MKEKHLFLFVVPVAFAIVFLVSFYLPTQASEIAMKAFSIYNDDELMSISNVHYTEQVYRVERGFPDFWNIDKVVSYVTAEYPDGEMKHYVVYTNIDTMEYEIK